MFKFFIEVKYGTKRSLIYFDCLLHSHTIQAGKEFDALLSFVKVRMCASIDLCVNLLVMYVFLKVLGGMIYDISGEG